MIKIKTVTNKLAWTCKVLKLKIFVWMSHMRRWSRPSSSQCIWQVAIKCCLSWLHVIAVTWRQWYYLPLFWLEKNHFHANVNGNVAMNTYAQHARTHVRAHRHAHTTWMTRPGMGIQKAGNANDMIKMIIYLTVTVTERFMSGKLFQPQPES